MKLHPLKFTPVFCYRIWGGDKLKTILNKQYDEDSIGESWEISAVQGFETRVSDGPESGKTLKELINQYKGDLVGKQVYEDFGEEFPLLIKYIDAAKPLSVQVHPGDELARERHDSFGKNEMWYVMGADEGAELIIGFNQQIDESQYERLLEQKEIMKVMNAQKVKPGDAFYIPTGRVHAIGAGVLLAEIQQTSDITYRIYDYDRVDARTGQKRELHVEEAKGAIDYSVRKSYHTDYEVKDNQANVLVHSPYFKTNLLIVKGEMNLDYTNLDSFVIFMCVEGNAVLRTSDSEHSIALGETLLIPASAGEVSLHSKGCRIIEVSL